jgi:hypothetical protein
LRGIAPLQGPDFYYPFPPGIKPGPIVLSGDPVSATGFVDATGKYWPYVPGERRFQIHSGPFSLAPGDTQEVVVAFVAGLGTDRLSSITVMKHITRQLKLWYPYHPDFRSDEEDLPGEILPPADYTLLQNYPNPFAASTRIQYSIPQDVQVRISIYDLLGKEVAVLEDSQKIQGFYDALWDGRDKSGRSVPSGIYLYKLKSAHLELTRKLLLVR